MTDSVEAPPRVKRPVVSDETKHWRKEARGLLVSLIKRRGYTYKGLANAMEALGLEETERSIASKINRGTFSLAFFLQAMQVLEFRKLSLKDVRKPAPSEAKKRGSSRKEPLG